MEEFTSRLVVGFTDVDGCDMGLRGTILRHHWRRSAARTTTSEISPPPDSRVQFSPFFLTVSRRLKAYRRRPRRRCLRSLYPPPPLLVLFVVPLQLLSDPPRSSCPFDCCPAPSTLPFGLRAGSWRYLLGTPEGSQSPTSRPIRWL